MYRLGKIQNSLGNVWNLPTICKAVNFPSLPPPLFFFPKFIGRKQKITQELCRKLVRRLSSRRIAIRNWRRCQWTNKYKFNLYSVSKNISGCVPVLESCSNGAAVVPKPRMRLPSSCSAHTSTCWLAVTSVVLIFVSKLLSFIAASDNTTQEKHHKIITKIKQTDGRKPFAKRSCLYY